MNIFKRIWNFFRPEKKDIESHFKKVSDVTIESKVIEHKVKKPHTQLFRNQQLPGKIYNIGKSRFRIKKLLGIGTEKLKYEITQL